VVLGAEKDVSNTGVYAPANDDPALMAKVAELRAAGTRVVCELSGQDGSAAAADCQQVLVLQNGQWIVADA